MSEVESWKLQGRLGVVVAGLALLLVVHGAALAEEGIFDGVIRGTRTEQIDGVDHTVEKHVGRPDGLSVTAQLERLGVEIAAEDRVSAFPDPQLGLGSAIRVVRATSLTLVDAGEENSYRTWASTVQAFLEERKIELGNDDTIDKDKNNPLVDKMTITITRVQVTEVVETELIPFKVVSVDDGSLELGQTKLLERGMNGKRVKTFRLRREDGKLVEKSLLRQSVSEEPIPERVAEGTKVTTYGSGQATWYALKSGMGAAHNTLPKGTKVRVTNLSNGKSVDVVINDHGIQGSAIIDLTADAFKLIAPLGAGRINVRIDKDYD